MEILKRPMGDYQTNCYIVKIDGKEIIIDPGMGATEWVMANVKNPVAILNTHGHFDHVWSNSALQEKLNIPLYSPKGDVMLLKNSTWMPELPPSTPDVEVDGDQTLDISGIEVKFHHFPGHCPGCSMIEIGDVIFSGDFLFEGSIGRWDFPYSDANSMRESLKKFAAWTIDKPLYPGHGNSTSVRAEQRNVEYWMRMV
ncbi:MBL fold metallo-hydrolase [Sulfuricurvum sp.]|uniref:MBL fold metallo-hydrolase n=1 Tax=Sulfuricurvum sp. TaxID=2025608 RepID=UPI002E3265BE|nr:MBL fold metallo-hydrolase [Sulfuricurvum sp.]HEX5329837.1 MBL fold metallo-hydrolase [Sulfuricurvum sp.]